ncbi:MAG: hypothetical protein V1735_04220 [Nanoarchaeota archaeon]
MHTFQGPEGSIDFSAIKKAGYIIYAVSLGFEGARSMECEAFDHYENRQWPVPPDAVLTLPVPTNGLSPLFDWIVFYKVPKLEIPPDTEEDIRLAGRKRRSEAVRVYQPVPLESRVEART